MDPRLRDRVAIGIAVVATVLAVVSPATSSALVTAHLLGVALLVGFGWWLVSGRAGPNLTPMAIPLAVAAAVPVIVWPVEGEWSTTRVAVAGLVTVIAMVPLAIALLDRVEQREERRLVGLIVIICTIGATVVVVITGMNDAWTQSAIARWALVGAIPLIPGLAAAGPIHAARLRRHQRPVPRLDRVRGRRRDATA